MKVFLTGGTGFIGSHFIQQALEHSIEVLALRRSRKSQCKIHLEKEPYWLEKTLTEVTADDLEGCDVVVHLAAHSANPPYDTIENCIKQNVLDPLAMFRQAVLVGIKKFIIAGSCFEYGRSGERYENIPVDAPLEPTMSYSASKAAATAAFYALACENSLQMQFLRVFHTYGEGEAATRFWPSLKKAAETGENMKMSHGEQVRDFMNVVDVAAEFVKAIFRDDIKENYPLIRNLGSGRPKKLSVFAKQEWGKWGATGSLELGAIPYRKNEIMRYVPEV